MSCLWAALRAKLDLPGRIVPSPAQRGLRGETAEMARKAQQELALLLLARRVPTFRFGQQLLQPKRTAALPQTRATLRIEGGC